MHGLFGSQAFGKPGHGLRPVCRLKRKTVHQRSLLRGRDLHAERRRQLHCAAAGPVSCRRRSFAGYKAIERRAHGVDVRPRPLLAVRAVLLYGRVAGLEHDRQAQFTVDALKPRSSEIKHLYASIAQHHEVRGADIAVDETFLMHLIQREHRRFEQVERLIKREFPMPYRIVGKILAIEVFHDDIRRAVFLEIVPEGDDAAVLNEPGEYPRLFQETLLSGFKGISVSLRRRVHRE